MSAPVYNVSVDGNSNDSNVILGSTNGSIVEDGNHDDSNLANKLAVLENALNLNSASDLAQDALVDANASGVATNASGVATNASGVSTNASGVATNLTRLDVHEGLVLKNIDDISANKATLAVHEGLVTKNIESIYEIYNKIVILETKLNESNVVDQWKLDPYLFGEWQLDPKEGSLSVGPIDTPGAWWSIGLEDVSNRSVLYDDIYKFNTEGTFQNILGEETWLEAFQGVSVEGAGAPVHPHDGSRMGNWSVYNDKIYIFGKGSYLGIPKVTNNAELTKDNVPNAIPDKVIYNIISKSLDNNYKYLELGINLFNQFTWRFKFRQESNRKVLFNEPFGGTLFDVSSNKLIHPSSGAESWGGFNNTNKSIYPLIFTSDGEIRFNAIVSEDVNIKFRFERNPYPDVDPAYDTSNILLTPGDISYNIAIPSQGNNTFSSLILYIVDKDKELILDNIYIYDDSIDYVEPEPEPEPELDLKMTAFGGTFNFYPEIYGVGETYIFSSIAESWAGFGNSNTDLYPFIFSKPGKITFDAALIDKEKGNGTKWNANDTPVNIKFKFEKNPFPDTEPSYTTANITISSYDLTSFSIDIPSQGTNTFSSFLLYLIEQDLPIKLTNLKVIHDNTPVARNILFDAVFGGAYYNTQFNVHILQETSESWAGFGNQDTTIYPIKFNSPGKLTFNATLYPEDYPENEPVDANVYFRFEKNGFPDTEPSYNTETITITADKTLYEIDIPSQGDNTFSSFLLYLVEKSTRVTFTNITLYADNDNL